jgi:hypothetical protein
MFIFYLKELSEDTKTLKEDFGRVKTHLNVAAKLELQTQEKMYESRLYHLENVLEEMRQREGHFMRLAEETAVLKDQVRIFVIANQQITATLILLLLAN